MKQEQADRIEALLKQTAENTKGLSERVAKLETQAGYFQMALGFILTTLCSVAYWLAKKVVGG